MDAEQSGPRWNGAFVGGEEGLRLSSGRERKHSELLKRMCQADLVSMWASMPSMALPVGIL